MQMLNVKQISIEDGDLAIEVGTCPGCGGLFGIDWTYLDQISTDVTCPMCGTEVSFGE